MQYLDIIMKNLLYKNILVISDNGLQCKKFYELIRRKKIDDLDVSFSWACSTYSSLKTIQDKAGLEFSVVDIKNPSSITEILKTYNLVISIHCKQLFPPELVNNIKCINVHPGYNPVNRGWYPQVFSIIHDTIVGATIHEIDEYVDHGNIIARMEVTKYSWDTSLELYKRILDAEMILLESYIETILYNEYKIVIPEEEGNLFLKKDFNQLCKIDLEELLTAKMLINKLRALTHEPYKNAYFIDEETGKRVFISINLEVEK